MEKHNWYLHVDLDAFFASVEQLDNPSYRGKPVIVGGKPEDKRSVVSTASYEARKYGVHSAMPTYQAYKLCPHGIYVHCRMKRYAELSYQIMNIFRDFSPDIQQMSIDEAFIDLTGTEQLFGPPSETALAIKKRVFEETGLTVSIGLATTQYLAKIASGYSKPDGFYFVEPGKEEEFMLSLPLDKLWGVGKKSQELLKSKGLKSIRDIYNTDIQLLEFLVGKNMAAFLYDAVRGGKNKDFGRESKSHSISAETTFSEDITDIYTAETAILELAQGVYFRLLRENGYSRTAVVKIRYDDFTTVSIRETEDNDILTLDSFFEILKHIFEKKYQAGRGIRLLGVGFDNIENEEKSYQPDLFDKGTEKRQAVEKAILKLEKKHPEIKIQKARLLKSIAIFILGCFISGGKFQKAYTEASSVKSKGAGTVIADNFPPPLIVEAPVSLLDLKISDKNSVDFLVSGYWQGEVTGGISGTFGNNFPLAVSTDIPIFKQSADLSAWFLLNNQFYFEADFFDEFQKNRIALGYMGKGILKSSELSNRNITMEKNYSAEYFGYALTGGKNQAPGLMMQLEDISSRKLWTGDFLFRYDMTESKSAVYYGKNLATDKKLPGSQFLYGYAFVFPENISNLLMDIKDIYIESDMGTFTDIKNKKYKKLSLSDYKIFQKDSMLILNSYASTGKKGDFIPSILVTFNAATSVDEIILNTGNYSEPESFAGKIQSFFESSGRNFDLSKFSYNLNSSIENSSALVIQNSIGFSPYLHCGFYDCGNNFDGDISVINMISEKSITDFSANSGNIFNGGEYLFDENHQIAEIVNQKNDNLSYQNPAVRYPLGDNEPEIYLNISSDDNTGLLLRHYTSVSTYDIGTEAISGTVLVYVNDIIDAGATYNQENGTIELSSQVLPSDKIYITWQEDSLNGNGGALSTAAGIKYNFTDKLKGDFLLSARWPVSVNTRYATTDNIQNGFAAFSTGIKYNNGNFSISDASAAAFINQNATDYLLVSQNTASISKTYYLMISDGYTTNTEPFISMTGKKFLAENNKTIKNHIGTKDSYISGYAIPLKWDFQKEKNNQWAALDVKLGNASELKNSTQFEIAIKPEFSAEALNETSEYDVYLQLGINAGSHSYGEDSYLLPTWKVSDISQENVVTPLDLSKNQWQTVTVTVDDEIRSKLSTFYDARILVTKKNDFNQITSGTLYVGPYKTNVSSAILMHSKKIKAEASSIPSISTPGSTKLHKNENYIAKISWNTASDILSEDDSTIKTVKYFTPADFSSYGTINLDFSILQDESQNITASSSPALTFILDSASRSSYSDGMEAVRLTINSIEHFAAKTQIWHTLTINLRSNQVFIDQIPLEKSNYTLIMTKNIIPDRMKLELNTICGSKLITKGTFCFDNLYYGETVSDFKLQNHFTAEYKKEGEILKLKELTVIKDALISFDSTQQFSTPVADISGEQNQKISANGLAKITVAQINLFADAGIDNGGQNNTPQFTETAYSFQTEKPLFSFLSFGENFRFNGILSAASKNDYIKFDFNKYNVPVSFGIKTQATDSYSIKNQDAAIDLNAGYVTKYAGINWKNTLTLKQKLQKKSSDLIDCQNPLSAFEKINAIEFSTGEQSSDFRNIVFNSKIDFPFPVIKTSPYLEFKGEKQYSKNTFGNVSENTSLIIGIPVTLNSSSFNISYTRNIGNIFSETLNYDYFNDINIYMENQPRQSWFYTVVPVYDFFDSELNSFITASKKSGLYKVSSYDSLLDFNLKRKFSSTLVDLFIPMSTTISFGRYISASDNLSESYQAKMNLGFSSLNNFGKYGKIKLFKFYEQDDVISNLTASMKVPSDKPENTVLAITAYFQTNIFITEHKQLSSALEFSGDTTSVWNVKFSSIYSRPGKTSLFTAIPLYFINNKFDLNEKIVRKDTFNLQIGNFSDGFLQKYEYLHSIEIKFMKYYTFNSGLGLTFATQTEKASSLSTTLTLGGKIEF